jgi:hypothetical protein
MNLSKLAQIPDLVRTNVRPELPASVPEAFEVLIKKCWDQIRCILERRSQGSTISNAFKLEENS